MWEHSFGKHIPPFPRGTGCTHATERIGYIKLDVIKGGDACYKCPSFYWKHQFQTFLEHLYLFSFNYSNIAVSLSVQSVHCIHKDCAKKCSHITPTSPLRNFQEPPAGR